MLWATDDESGWADVMATSSGDPSLLLEQHIRALDMLCGLHPCITRDGPPELVAEMIFDHIQAEYRVLQERISSLESSVDFIRRQLK